jgi:hypothetical protein
MEGGLRFLGGWVRQRLRYSDRVTRAQDQLASRFRRAVLYVVRELGDVNVTKLQKILYLADLEHFHATGTTLSGARWVRYTHGPMAKALVPSRNLLDGHELDVRTEQRGAYEAVVYRPGPKPRFNPALAAEERSTLDRIIGLMRPMSTTDAIAVAYNTGPMKLIQSMERANGGSLMLDTEISFDIDTSMLADVVGREPTLSPEKRALFKRRQVGRTEDLQQAVFDLAG